MAFYRSITVNHSQVTGSLSNFPVLVRILDSTLATTGNGGNVVSSTGADILFWTDATLTTQLPSEIDQYDPSAGSLWAWVRLPSVTSSADVTFYCSYGSATPPARTGALWNTYAGVWHFNGSGLTEADSSANGNTVTASSAPSSVVGKIGSARMMTSALSQGSPVGLPSTFPITIEAWVASTSNPISGPIMAFATGFGTPSMLGSSGNQLYYFQSFQTRYGSVIPFSTWTHVAFVFASSTSVLEYVNGLSTGAIDQPYGSLTLGSPFVGLGSSAYGFSLDEARISGVARTPEWMLTQYQNQNAPASFLTIGAESGISSVAPFTPLRPNILLPFNESI